MCGRYAASRSPDDLVEEFELPAPVGEDAHTAADPQEEAPAPSWNVAPTDAVQVVLERRPRAEPTAPPRRQLRVARWGLVPSWAKNRAIGSRLINARVETVAEKPAFRAAFASRRCLIPADGYYEWYTSTARAVGAATGAKGRPLKQPFFIRPRDGGVLAMAGLYELWRERREAGGDDAPARWLWTCTVITTHAQDDLGRIHDRMPMLVERDRYSEWLAPDVDDADDLRALLVPAAPGRLEAVPVSTEVNSVRNNGPQLVRPLPLEDVPADVRDGATPGAPRHRPRDLSGDEGVADQPVLF